MSDDRDPPLVAIGAGLVLVGAVVISVFVSIQMRKDAQFPLYIDVRTTAQRFESGECCLHFVHNGNHRVTFIEPDVCRQLPNWSCIRLRVESSKLSFFSRVEESRCR